MRDDHAFFYATESNFGAWLILLREKNTPENSSECSSSTKKSDGSLNFRLHLRRKARDSRAIYTLPSDYRERARKLHGAFSPSSGRGKLRYVISDPLEDNGILYRTITGKDRK